MGAAGVARAETLDVKIPFAFVVHGQTLPAGDAPVLTFTHAETQYRLDTIWQSATKGGTVRN